MIDFKVFLWSLTASLSGFLFGFDTVVVSGAEQQIQELWGLSPVVHGIAMSSALWGTVFGALIGSWPTDAIGRRSTLLTVGVLYFVSAIWSGLATGPTSFVIARFIGGVGVGVSTVAAPLYISEISPPGSRGRLAGLFQFNIVFGILVAFVSNTVISQVGENAWRWMLGVEALPAALYTILAPGLPESPRWLFSRGGDPARGRATLALLNPEFTPAEVDELAERISSTAARDREALTSFWSRRMLWPISMAVLIAMFNQLSGINAILYFAPRIFQMAGLGEHAALLQSIGIGVTNLVFTFVGLWLIDRVGRRTLLIVGSIGYVVSLGLCSWAFASGREALVPPCVFAFIAAHAIGQGAVIWVFISEIFPTRYRAQGQALGSSTHWIFAAGLTLAFPAIVSSVPPAAIFGLFAAMMVLQLVWVLAAVPETRGVPLEVIEAKLGVSEAL
ncbi:MAG: Arabinose-proton symporter [Planctomycetota bacterium]